MKADPPMLIDHNFLYETDVRSPILQTRRRTTRSNRKVQAKVCRTEKSAAGQRSRMRKSMNWKEDLPLKNTCRVRKGQISHVA